MKKLLSITAIIMVTAISLQAQSQAKPLGISIGVDAGLPAGNAGQVFSFVLGGSLQGEYKVDPQLGLTLSAGYKSWSVKKNLRTQSGGNTSDFIPVLAGIKYYFSPLVYGSGQLGLSISTESGGNSSFTYAPGIGYKISDNFDVLAKYTGISAKGGGSLNEVGVRLAYGF